MEVTALGAGETEESIARELMEQTGFSRWQSPGVIKHVTGQTSRVQETVETSWAI